MRQLLLLLALMAGAAPPRVASAASHGQLPFQQLDRPAPVLESPLLVHGARRLHHGGEGCFHKMHQIARQAGSAQGVCRQKATGLIHPITTDLPAEPSMGGPQGGGPSGRDESSTHQGGDGGGGDKGRSGPQVALPLSSWAGETLVHDGWLMAAFVLAWAAGKAGQGGNQETGGLNPSQPA